ncbi:MAG: hypothetical protein MJ182_08705 [Treponema sp.]|nr:hypothetical protein [Treponema sp.]
MNLAHLFEAGMLVCFGFSWPINVVKAYKAGTAKSTSLAFIFLIITGYILGISAKVINHQFNYVLAVYILNLVIVFSNVLVYFRNRALDKKREDSKENTNQKKSKKVVYAHEEQIVFAEEKTSASKKYNISLMGGTYAKDIPVKKLADEFQFDFDIHNRSSFALSLKNAKEYYGKYVAGLKSDGIILQLGKEDADIFKANPSVFDTLYLELLNQIKSTNKDCRLALVSINNSMNNTTIAQMNNHIKAIAQSEQATFVNLENAFSWNPKGLQSSLDFAQGMGLKYKKPIYDIAEILYSYAVQNIAEDHMELNVAV